MNSIKNSWCLWTVVCVILLGLFTSVMAQNPIEPAAESRVEITDSPSATAGNGTIDLPKSKSQYWTLAISAITPMIVYLFGKIPQLPRPILPVITPFVGVGLGLLLDKMTSLNFTWWDSAQAGALAVFIRESINQAIIKQMKPGEGSKTKAQPVDGNISAQPGEKIPQNAKPGETVNPYKGI